MVINLELHGFTSYMYYYLQMKTFQRKFSQFSAAKVSNDCLYKETTYKNRDHWSDGDCRSCYCQVNLLSYNFDTKNGKVEVKKNTRRIHLNMQAKEIGRIEFATFFNMNRMTSHKN